MVPAEKDAGVENAQAAKRPRSSSAIDTAQTEEEEHSDSKSKAEVLMSPSSAVRESSRLRNKAALSAKAKQETLKPQLDTDLQSLQQPTQHGSTAGKSGNGPHREAVMEAARAAQRVKDACTIDEAELLALRPTLLKGYAAIHSQERNESLEAELKSLLYYFRHHTVEPEILKRLCFVEIVFCLRGHANRLVADLAAQLITLGPWKVVYDQLRVLNAPWFDKHAVAYPGQPLGAGVAAPGGAVPVPVAAALQKQVSGV